MEPPWIETRVSLENCGLPGSDLASGEVTTSPDFSSPAPSPCLSVAEPEPQRLCQLCQPQRYQGEHGRPSPGGGLQAG